MIVVVRWPLVAAVSAALACPKCYRGRTSTLATLVGVAEKMRDIDDEMRVPQLTIAEWTARVSRARSTTTTEEVLEMLDDMRGPWPV